MACIIIRLFDWRNMAFFSSIYGIANTKMETAAPILGQALQRTFKLHDSDFIGEHYVARSEDWNEIFDVSENFNPIEEEWDFANFQEYSIIFQVSLSERTIEDLQQIEKDIEKIANLKIMLLEKYTDEDENTN
jgi:hypothetical protein